MIPEDVRDIIESTMRQWAEHWDEYDTSMDGRYSASAHEDLDAVLAWLDAQPEAPEPDWATAPEWAMWWVVEPNGDAYWWQAEPWVVENDHWDHPEYRTVRADVAGEVDLPLGIDWRTTLRHRPEEVQP